MSFVVGESVGFVAPGGIVVPAIVCGTTKQGGYDVIVLEPLAWTRLGIVQVRTWPDAREDESTPEVGTIHSWAAHPAVATRLQAAVAAERERQAEALRTATGRVPTTPTPDAQSLVGEIALLRAELRALGAKAAEEASA